MLRNLGLLLLAGFVMSPSAAGAYVLQTDRNQQGQIVTVRWPVSTAQNGIRYRVSTGSFPFESADILRITDASFDAWNDVPTSAATAGREATGTFRASVTDRRHVITYDATGNDIGAPRGSGVIAVTIINSDNAGNILDSDIVFNGRDFRFSVDPDGPSGSRVDLQDVMTHEIGHFLGLDHSPLDGLPGLRPTMNPYNDALHPGEARSLETDDHAGLTTLYPSAQASSTGAIAGRVLTHEGDGAYGVHVIAYEAGTSLFVASALSSSIGSEAGPRGDGRYEIAGLPPGNYQVAIEPVGSGITYRNFGGIFEQPFETGFLREYYSNVSVRSAAAILNVGAGRVLTDIDFALGTAAPGAPFASDFDLPVDTPDAAGPYPVRAGIRDDGAVTVTEVRYRVDGGVELRLPMTPEDGLYTVGIPGQPMGAVVSYRIYAADDDGNEVLVPTADLDPFRFEVLTFSGEPVLYVALRRSQEVSVIDTGPGAELARIPTGEDPLSVALTPDGRYLFVANSGARTDLSDNRITVIETATHRVVRQIDVGESPLDLALTSDGRRVYVSNSGDRSVSVIDAVRLLALETLSAPVSGTGPFGIVLSPDAAVVYVTDSDASQVLAIDTESGSLVQRIDVVASPRSMVVDADRQRLYVSGFDGGITVISTETNGAVGSIDTAPAGGVFRMALSPNGARLYATDWLSAALLVVDPVGLRLTDRLSVPVGGQNTRDLALSADGSMVYVANQDSNELLFYDAATLLLRNRIELADGPRGIAFRARPPGHGGSASAHAASDFDRSGRIDFNDFLLFAAAFGSRIGTPGFDPMFDLNGSGLVDFNDFLIFAGTFGSRR